jgi:cbb3-type cytochrome oxidase subunit 3
MASLRSFFMHIHILEHVVFFPLHFFLLFCICITLILCFISIFHKKKKKKKEEKKLLLPSS